MIVSYYQNLIRFDFVFFREFFLIILKFLLYFIICFYYIIFEILIERD